MTQQNYGFSIRHFEERIATHPCGVAGDCVHRRDTRDGGGFRGRTSQGESGRHRIELTRLQNDHRESSEILPADAMPDLRGPDDLGHPAGTVLHDADGWI